jgi:polysaccharide biosynthesis protein VpsQ
MLLKRWLPFSLFLLLIVSIIVANDFGRLRSIINLVTAMPSGDKCGHAIFIGTLAFLLNYALAGQMVKIGRRKILWGCVIVAVAITAEEISQIWIPSRTFDLGDLAANYFGITLAGYLWLYRTKIPSK